MTTSIDPDPDKKPVDNTDDEPILTPKLNPRWAMGAIHLLVVAVFGLLFMITSYLPLQSPELWGSVVYGNWILDHRTVPVEDPFLPLAEGMQVLNTTWLAQVIFAGVERLGSVHWLSHLFSLTVLVTFLVLGRTFYLQSRRPIVMLMGILVVATIGFNRLIALRPELLAMFCFACLLWWVVGSEYSAAPHSGNLSNDNSDKRATRNWPLWCGVPVLFALWANMHESFVWGLAVLGCFLLGRIIEVLWQTRSPRAVLVDPLTRRWLYLCELGALATLLNPHGIDLWLRPLWFSTGAEGLGTPLHMLAWGGREFAISWVVLLVVLRHSRCRVPPAHALLLGVFSLAAVFNSQRLSWYAPVFGVVLVPHLADLLARLRPIEAKSPKSSTDRLVPAGRSWVYSLLCLLLIWVAFALSPISTAVLGRAPRTPEQLFGDAMPLGLTAYLRGNPPPGQVIHPPQWGDWMVWDGPPGIQPFMNSNPRAIPLQTARDYRILALARSDWQRVLTRYRVRTAIFDKQRQSSPIRGLRRDEDWEVAYEDRQAIVFARRTNDRAPGRAPDSSASPDTTTNRREQEPRTNTR